MRDVAKIMGYVPQNHVPAYAYSVRDFVVMGRAPYLGTFQQPSEEDYALTDQVARRDGNVRTCVSSLYEYQRWRAAAGCDCEGDRAATGADFVR